MGSRRGAAFTIHWLVAVTPQYRIVRPVERSESSAKRAEAVGRKFYSDRETNDTELGYEEQSF
ncbi:hypothetical protein SAMN05216388_101918 [Halorientalis persicus]|uniref:Uncharacterized protein n=1 Tax=Halorientalis persicus TaxID=1367881 RepID=A0A1H8SG78_9EURY|nr:hypothetical protein SAMN05216388_101918 [Halorientalis persicus]